MSSIEREAGWRRDLLVLAAVAAAFCVVFFDVLFLGNGFFLRDVASYSYPMKWVVRAAIFSGEFPYWNPAYSGGEPLAANPAYNLFYPGQWLILLPNFRFAFQFQIVFHFFLGAAGTYVLLRVLGLGWTASAMGSVAFGFSGFLFALSNLPPNFVAAVWVPWFLAFVHLLSTRPSAVYFLGAATTFGLQILTGEPGTILMSLAFAAGYGLYQISTTKRGHGALRSGVLLAAAVGAGFMLGAAQLIPALDFFPETTRGQGFPYEHSRNFSMTPTRPLEFIYPSFFGSNDPTRGLYWGYVLYLPQTRPYLWSIYVGLLPVVLALAGVIRRVPGWVPLIVIAAVSYVVSIGTAGWVFKWLHQSGIFKTLRFPERFFVVVLVAVVVFAAFAFQRVLDGDRGVIITGVILATVITVIALIAAVWTYRPDYVGRFTRWWGLPSVPRVTEMAELNQREWWMAVLRGAVVTVLLLWRLRGRTRAWDASVFVYLLADLGLLANRVVPRMPREFFTPPEIANRLPPARGDYRIFHIAMQTQGPDATRYASLNAGTSWVVRNGLFPFNASTWGFRTIHERSIDETRLSWAEDITKVLAEASRRRPGDWADRISAFSNARFQAFYRPFDEALARAGGDVENLLPVYFVESRFYARYYFADRLVTIADRDDFLDRITSAHFTDRTACISSTPFRPAPGRLRRIHESRNRVALEVEADGLAFLVVSNTFHKYWRATVDGRRVPIERTNHAFQGVRVGPGKHRVEFAYRNPLVLLGIVISLLTLAALVIVCLAAVRRRPREA